MTPPTPRRRWFQFGLGTMFVVMTGLALLLAYHVKWIRQRHAALEEWESSEWRGDRPVLVEPPGLLGFFGERGCGTLWREFSMTISQEAYDAEVAHVRALFPEAAVFSWHDELSPDPQP